MKTYYGIAFLVLAALLSISYTSSAQTDDILTLNYLEDDFSALNYKLPVCEECSILKKKFYNGCFMSTIESLLLRNLRYPIDALFADKKGEVTVEIVFPNLEKKPKVNILSSTSKEFEQAAINAVKALPEFHSATRNKEQLAFKLIYTFHFSPEKWKSYPANMVELHADYYSDMSGIDSTFFQQICDSCTTSNSIYRHFHDVLINQINATIKSDEKLIMPKSGHVFSKYTINSSGQFLLCDNEFENNTTLTHSELKSLFSTVSFLEQLNIDYSPLADSERMLLLYFNENGLYNPNDPDNQTERMPVFPGKCQKIEDEEEQARCTEAAIMKHIGKNTVYPNSALMAGVKGRVFVEFIIETTGYVSNVKVIKGVSLSLDNAAMDCIKSLPRMEPARQRGRAVKLKYTIPVSFQFN